jgi:hypothetical protein
VPNYYPGKGTKFSACQSTHRSRAIPARENNGDKIFNIVGEGSDPSDSQNYYIQNNIGPSDNFTVL